MDMDLVVDDTANGGLLGGIIALIIWGVSRVTRGSDNKHSAVISPASVREGEITKEQFEQLKKDLS